MAQHQPTMGSVATTNRGSRSSMIVSRDGTCVNKLPVSLTFSLFPLEGHSAPPQILFNVQDADCCGRHKYYLPHPVTPGDLLRVMVAAGRRACPDPPKAKTGMLPNIQSVKLLTYRQRAESGEAPQHQPPKPTSQKRNPYRRPKV